MRAFAQRAKWNRRFSKKCDIINICLEGDSTDNTYKLIQDQSNNHKIILLKHDTGAPHYPSQVIPERLQLLGRLSNIVLDRAMQENPTHILWLDSDIDVQDGYLEKLLAHDRDVVAPMFYFDDSTYFRDTWGYRANGWQEFTNAYPYTKVYNNKSLFEVDSVGLPLIKAHVIKNGARFGNEEIVDLCRSIKSLGYKIYVDPKTYATHARNGTIVPERHERHGRNIVT